jgi:hypothetical protein
LLQAPAVDITNTNIRLGTGMLLLSKLAAPDRPAAARTLAQPMLQLLAPAVKDYHQQLQQQKQQQQQQQEQQQQQQQGSATVKVFWMQVTPQQAEQLKLAQAFVQLLVETSLSGECGLYLQSTSYG